MTDPTPEDLATFTSCTAIFDWIGNIPEETRAAVSDVLGITNWTEHPNTVGNMEPGDVNEILKTVRVAEMPLSLGQLTKVRLFYRMARIVAGNIETGVAKRARESLEHEQAVAMAQASGYGMGPPPTGGAQPPTQARAMPYQKKFKLTVLDQTAETEIVCLPESELQAMFTRYHLAHGGTADSLVMKTPRSMRSHQVSS